MSTKRRLASGVLENILKYSEDTEIPPTYAIWSGVASIAACLGRNCYIDLGFMTIYPNMYIVLVAGSAMCKKSTSIALASEFLAEVQPAVKRISQKVTVQALIMALAGGGEKSSLSIIGAGTGIAVVDELYTMINKESFRDGMIPVLTKLYDCKDFEYETVGRGTEVVRSPCLSILGGSTSEWIREAIPMVSVGGGFTSRVVFVYQGKNTKEVSLLDLCLTPENRERKRSIVNDLCAITEMRGPFGYDETVKKVFREEYHEFRRTSELLDESSLSGYCGRRDAMLLKIAMIVSASRSSDRMLTVDDLGIAKSILLKAENEMPSVLASITSKDIGNAIDQVLTFIRRHRVVTRTDLVNKFRSQMLSDELFMLVKTLNDSHLVKTEVEGSKVRYIYTGA